MKNVVTFIIFFIISWFEFAGGRPCLGALWSGLAGLFIQQDDSVFSVQAKPFGSSQADCIVANRWHADLTDVTDKVYTRDIFQMD